MDLTLEQAGQIATEGYVFLYPLVTMELTRRQSTSGPAGVRPGRGPMGMFSHIREFPTAEFKMVVRPNFDTLYSSAWLDLRPEPVIVSAPAAGDRFYMLPCLDMWTDVFASPGTRTSGPEAISFALARPDWRGSLPDGVWRIDSPTPVVWVIGRTQTNGADDYGAVRAFQDQLSISPLSYWGSTPPSPPVVDDPSVDTVTPPLDQVNALPAADFFALAAELVALHPPHPTDWGQLARLRRIGFVVGEPFSLGKVSPDLQEAISSAPGEAQSQLVARQPKLAPLVNGWLTMTDSVGVYGDFYTKRAIVAMGGLGANQPEDAIYPLLHVDADGSPLDGAHSYVIHFDAGRLPPVDAFWSVTMYDSKGFQAANELNRFAIGDRDDLTYNADGSLDLYLGRNSPGPDKVPNWLPAPPGPLGVTMRLYAPRPAALSGDWSPPPVRKMQ
ncbi:MAG TPA: DUF1254 domain-containing protein [Acidimicrobiales bacterium]|nr:DUF1254 domain-containing protein [Acidimicrobiales bacterium]